jgi:hypothetical protein
MKNLLAVAAVLCVSGCASTVTIRSSSNDFLQQKGTMVQLNVPVGAVEAELDRTFSELGFSRSDALPGANNSEVVIYKGPRYVPREAADFGVQLGSWFAARLVNQGAQTTLILYGKPMIGTVEVCDDGDSDLKDIKYVCSDTKVPSNWMGLNLVTGRDEETVVSNTLAKIYERFKG